jgi:SAM-dependent methyltransferase
VTNFGYAHPAHQAWMVLDRVRTELFAEAIRRTVKPGDVVLDVGTGSGVLALLAAKAGARRVFAVERGDAYMLARRHVEENGLSHVIEVLHTDLTKIDALPEQPDVIVSEMLGHFAPDEAIHPIFRRAKALCKPDVRMIPGSYRLLFSVAELPQLASDVAYLRGGLDITLDAIATRILRAPELSNVEAEHLLGPEVPGDLFAVDAPEPLRFACDVVVSRTGTCNALVLAFESELAPGVCLRTSPHDAATHWGQVVFPIEALAVTEGDVLKVVVEPRVMTDRATYLWEVEGPSGKRVHDALDSNPDASDLELARYFGHVPTPEVIPDTELLTAYRTLLAGPAGETSEAAIARLMAASTGRFAEQGPARSVLMKLLDSAEALD